MAVDRMTLDLDEDDRPADPSFSAASWPLHRLRYRGCVNMAFLPL